MFSNVVQMVFGSVLQFMGSYVGLTQQYRQLNEGVTVDEQGNPVRQFERDGGYITDRPRRKKKQMATWRSTLWTLLKRLGFLAVLYVIISRTIRFFTAPSQESIEFSSGFHAQ
jgi:hypothetical protein